ncbi:M15 family metallopeptidase [Nocardioides sp. zg-1308]|uniref:M15 family metallopeptidase n=1 Tax=Nocardioides sp. zg-1308 TaxID=2736253 RepID=UPI001556A06E|nr:M15 family metallopeptidase [Nocardioides sp. zg-1308]
MGHRAAGMVVAVVVTALMVGCSAGADTTAPARSAPGEQAGEQAGEPAGGGAPAADPAPLRQPDPFDLTRHSIDDPRSPWVVVNQRRPLRPATHRPELAVVEGYLVHPRVVRPLAALLGAGRRAALDLRVMSAYRSHGRQAQLYAGAVAARGAERAARTTAPAGHSEHQTGLAVDLGRASTGECNVQACFARTREARWLRRHAHRFGFVLRYPARGQRMTGYAHESWHFRHVGRPLATHLRRERIPTLEDAFGLVGAGS